MMTENSGIFQLASSSSPANSPNAHQQQPILNNPHDGNSNLHQQQSGISIKGEQDFEYVDESGNPIVAHNYTRNHINNEAELNQQQQQIEMLNATQAAGGGGAGGGGGVGGGGGGGDQQQQGGNVYHINANSTSNAGGGGGGGNSINDTRRTVLSNNKSNNSAVVPQQQQQQGSSRQQSSLSSPPPHQISQHIRSQQQQQQQQQSVVRSASPATSWHQPGHLQTGVAGPAGDHHHTATTTTTTTTSSSSTTSGQQQQHIPPPNAFGILRHEQDVLYITETCIEIGRNSSTSRVHFHVDKNSFVSRKHFRIIFDPQTGDFYLICLSKNGIFVDDVFQRRSTEPVKLPKSCTFRFPSTEIRIAFESFSDKVQSNLKAVENSNVIYSPLKISIPKQEQKSPYPSPTGTISAANSCPTSPRQGFQEYHQYNYNNNNNFQNNQEMFQPPSTSTYNEHEKPPYSYAQLIVQSISASPDKQLTLSGIYSFISKHYPYYRKEANKGWQNSIRHNLSLNRYFIKVARSQDEPGKGSFWRIDPNSEAKLIDQSYKKRRQRGSQCFRPPYGMPRSAPVSPSHIDNSRENSPLHDIVLQSAPGSPGVSYQNSHGAENNHASASSSDETNNYGNANIVQQAYNSHSQHNQYNNSSSGYYSSSSAISATGQAGPIGPLKRHQPSSSGVVTGAGSGGGGGVGGTATTTGTGSTSAGAAASAVIQGAGPMYDEMSDYGQGADSDDCETIKRQKYTNEVN